MVERVDGVVRRVQLASEGVEVEPVCRFLAHVIDSGGSPNTALSYGYDLKRLFEFLAEDDLDWRTFSPALSLEFLGWLRRRPSGRPAQRLGLGVVSGQGRLLAPATAARALAAVSSFYGWASLAGDFSGEHPMLRRRDAALARVAERHQPFTGGASRQQPMQRQVRVRVPQRLPRPMADDDVAAVLASMTKVRDVAMLLLMLDGGLRPGEVLGLRLEDVSYGRRRVVIRCRDDHPHGVRQKSRQERVVDLAEARTLDTLNRYVLRERPAEAASRLVFLVGGRGTRRCEPLSYSAAARLFARHLDRLGMRAPDKTLHALRHTHATQMWEGGMRELALQRRLGHASVESTRIYTRVSDDAVRAEYHAALQARR